jgi:hypothetical protein
MGAASLPVLIWSAHFTLIYGFTALACARQLTAAIPWVVGAASVAAIAALLALCVPAGIRVLRASQLADCLALGLGGLATLAVVWEASALFWVPACG